MPQLDKCLKFMAFRGVILYRVKSFLSSRIDLILDIYPVVTLYITAMLILFTKDLKFHHENPQFLLHPIKFAIVDSSTTPDCKTKLTIKATGKIFAGARSKHAFELQHDRESISC